MDCDHLVKMAMTGWAAVLTASTHISQSRWQYPVIPNSTEEDDRGDEKRGVVQ